MTDLGGTKKTYGAGLEWIGRGGEGGGKTATTQEDKISNLFIPMSFYVTYVFQRNFLVVQLGNESK